MGNGKKQKNEKSPHATYKVHRTHPFTSVSCECHKICVVNLALRGQSFLVDAVETVVFANPRFHSVAIVKDPKLTRKQGAYSVIAATGAILKRGHELARVLAVFDKKLKLVT